ncbi:MAG: hypothetical protein HFF06_01345 [Oscillospiraceae bacterium]|jgi:hypothetical protein|nr:hypothetical protein [Oscillospiraceae bacterium]
MKRLLLALLCAAPLATGVPVEEVQAPLPQETPAVVELAFCPSMGCDLENCTDPDHYHYCLAGCTDAAHYHNCPVGCADPVHPYCGRYWEMDTQAEPEFWTSMGCNLENCTDPDHHHYCLAGCTDAAHYHNCPVGCADPTHPHCGQCWEDGTEEVLPPCYGGMGYGHHGGRRGHHGGWRY